MGYQRYPINFEPTCYEEVVWSQAIKKIPPLLDSYSEQLQDEGVRSNSYSQIIFTHGTFIMLFKHFCLYYL